MEEQKNLKREDSSVCLWWASLFCEYFYYRWDNHTIYWFTTFQVSEMPEDWNEARMCEPGIQTKWTKKDTHDCKKKKN